MKGVLDFIIWKFFGYTDLHVRWNVPTAVDPQVQSVIDDQRIRNGSKTINECRAELGLGPVPWGDRAGPAAPPDPEPDATSFGKVLKLDTAKAAPRGKALPASIRRDRPARAMFERHIKKAVARHLGGKVKTAVIASAVRLYAVSPKPSRKVGKADSPADDAELKALVDAVLQKLELDGFDIMEPEVHALVEQLVKDAGREALGQVGVNTSAALDLVNDEAVAFATARAAELVTRIGESTRNMLRADVTDAMTEGWSADRLATVLGDNYAFSDERSQMIARTETAYADVQGNLAGYRASGVVEGKRWITGAGCCDDCAELDGVTVALDDTFDAGDEAIDGPPYHPNCRCDIVPVLFDETDTEAANRLVGPADESTTG